AVAIGFRQAAERKYLICGRVPRQNVPATAADIGGLVEACDQAAERCRHDLRHERPATGIARQFAKMGMFDLAQAKRTRQGIDRSDGRTDSSALLQPDVPVDADACEFS